METLAWQGPKQLWHEDPTNCILQDELAQSPGIYLWTVEVNDVHFVNYVGMTSKSIADRQREHLDGYLAGKYWIYDSELFRQGRKQEIYRPEPSLGVAKFLKDYEVLARKLYKFLRTITLLYLPIDKETAELKQIESGLISTLQSSDDKVKDFLDNYHVSLSVPDEGKTSVRMCFPVPIAGLDEYIAI